jgi:hypothetical protein
VNKSLEQIEQRERDLLQELLAAQEAYEQAAPADRPAARQRYLAALKVFCGLVRHGDQGANRVTTARSISCLAMWRP